MHYESKQSLSPWPKSESMRNLWKLIKWRGKIFGCFLDNYYILSEHIGKYEQLSHNGNIEIRYYNTHKIKENINKLYNIFPVERRPMLEEICCDGNHLICLFDGDCIVGYLIFNTKERYIYNIKFSAPNDAAWVRYIYVRNEHRGYNYGTLLKIYAAQIMRENNITHILSWVSGMNEASIKIHKHLGCTIIAHNVYKNIFNILKLHIPLYKNKSLYECL